MATQRQVLAACRKRWPKYQIQIRENKSAPTPADREVLSAKRTEKRERKDIVAGLLKDMAKPEIVWGDLMFQAQFVLDVNGDPTALDELRKALAAATAYVELRDEFRELEQEIRNIRTHSRRFSVSRWDGQSMFTHSCADGDTLDECLEKIRGEAVLV